MTQKIVWDATGERLYETGVDHGVLYPVDENGAYSKGYAWNGLSNITESPSGAEATAIYADNIKYLNLYSTEEFGATVEAYMYPDEFAECDGSASIADGVRIGQQPRKTFGLCYRTNIGNDIEGDAYGYKIHLIYGAKASPSEQAYQTVNDSPEAITFSWELTTTPVNVTGFKPTANVIIDSTKTTDEKMAAIEEILYGKAVSDAVYAVVPSTATYDSSKTYYTKSGDTYTEASISEFASGTTYYTLVSAAVAEAVEARMPLPDEIMTIMNS